MFKAHKYLNVEMLKYWTRMHKTNGFAVPTKKLRLNWGRDEGGEQRREEEEEERKRNLKVKNPTPF